ncbi:MAG: hypothetical protein Kow0099_04290 [Candidatus Abyssubacteria bacterium]
MKHITIAMLITLLTATVWADSATFELGSGVDDAYGVTGADDLNNWNHTTFQIFGHWHITDHRDMKAYYRWALTLPRCSKVSASNVSFKASNSDSLSFTALIWGLLKDDKWEKPDAFKDTSYSNGSALDYIPITDTSVNYAPGPWTAGNWYDTPDISSIVQEALDSTDYDPTHYEDKYVGIKVEDNGSGPWTALYVRRPYSYENGAANAAELDVIYIPRAEASIGNFWQVRGGFIVYRGY